ncbi:pyrroloquinoline quinone biosynthesis protein PqqB [Entomobacter blattae]|uniref:Coenzyme PQQ synthesis protein B n=1 Tax=Entomobacter blattae TaxID=2762277 RepID=A0A7H1NPR5_9PROT|nr:pyrroloquinoline quinone biosynthesis protein PqqB [Entomobacter blattae]QNT77775.1 Coenzyme PQQ synthesis protein B [Entomobacter blattae]
MMEIIVLGSAAGGGFPQWNCNSLASQRVRNHDPFAKYRTQASIAVSADHEHWFIINASPDLRSQILATQELTPKEGKRSTPIAGVILTGGEVDVVAGLLTLREREHFNLLATSEVLHILQSNPIFSALDPNFVNRQTLRLEHPQELNLKNGAPSGLTITAFAVPGKVPLYLEKEEDPAAITENGDTIGLKITDGKKTVFYIPGCAFIPLSLAQRLYGADAVFFDGTLWRDDEMIKAGLSEKTGQRMGHMSIHGDQGTLKAFEHIKINQKIFIHVNNSNPILLEDSPEYRLTQQAGWDVAFDGMRIIYE